MKENLKTAHYSDGTPILFITGNDYWDTLTVSDKAYCWYNDDSSTYANNFGALYTWSAAMNGEISSIDSQSNIQGICPSGWHLPSDAEWNSLEGYLTNNGYSHFEGKSLKSISGWNNDGNGTDDFGFKALPGGFRAHNGNFIGINEYGKWWSSRASSTYSAYCRELIYNFNRIFRYPEFMEIGFSVRCIQDNISSSTYKINSHEIILYPNPTCQNIHIESEVLITEIEILDLTGNLLYIETLNSKNANLDLLRLSKGYYFVRFKTKAGLILKKIIIE